MKGKKLKFQVFAWPNQGEGMLVICGATQKMLKPDVSKEKGGKVVVQSLLCKKYLYLILWK